MEKRDIVDLINDNIVKIIGHYILLEEDASRYKGKCPWGCEKNLFVVKPDEKRWKCFTCGEEGDAVKFIMMYERVDFIDAIKIGKEILM